MSTFNDHLLVLVALISAVLGEGTSQGGQSTGKAAPTGGSGGSGGGKGGGMSAAEAKAMNTDNELFANYILISLAAVVGGIAIYRTILYAVRYVRTLTCLNNDTQRYFQLPNPTFASIKEHFLYAPLFRTRHLREIRLSSALSMYILPTRFQSVFLAGVVGMNVALCCIGIEWHGPQTLLLGHLRNRTGTLAVVNMIPLVVMGGRNNPLIALLNISYDSFNLVHRWFGRMVIFQVIAHTVAWTVKEVQTSGWTGVHKALMGSQLIYTGFIGTVAMVAILFQASSIFRHAFYETFLHLHIALAILSIAGVWIHLDGLPAKGYLKAVIVLWAAERFVRLCTLIYRNLGKGGTKAIVEALPGDAIRVTMKMARPWTFRPGQHMYVTMPSVGLWTSHPFSVAWSDAEEHLEPEKGLAVSRQDVLALQKTTMSIIIRRRTGFTNQLFEKAQRSPDGRATLNALVEGPYGGLHALHSYGTVMLFAGGVGITHQVPYVRELVAGHAAGTVAARKVVLIWVIRSPEHLEWIRPWMTQILAMDKRRDVLRIQLFVTRPRSTKEIHSPSATVQMFPGKPNVDTLVEMEVEHRIGAMGVSVCGTGGLADDVRRAVRRRQGGGNVDFVEESFSW
ncbi:ferric-chelate reductase [Lasallia pustulata]|nr:ferric-chelate reductase [Lasallia pustulata]